MPYLEGHLLKLNKEKGKKYLSAISVKFMLMKAAGMTS